MTVVDEIRRFNRFYTRRIGLLDEGLSQSPFPLVEARVLYEIAQGEAASAADLSRALDMDKAHLSRVLARLRAQGLVATTPSPQHAKRRLLFLTDAGRGAFAALEQGTRAQIEGLLAPLDEPGRGRLAGAMQTVRTLLGEPSGAQAFTLRAPRVGDLGWIVHRQSVLYGEEYGWDWRYEGLVAEILGRFVAGFDATKEAAWIAERDGAILGSIFLMRGDDEATAKLRLLYVEPGARGLGLGAALVEACVAGARARGYRRLVLWTNDILVSARRLYQRAGFALVSEEKHHSFGCDLVGQTWTLNLESAEGG